MKYPRIYSISTVGMLKHYNQDYLIHPIRTDFVGSNGIGKSILADLLQLLFIFDKPLIVFGTEGLKKADRQIHKLPYKVSEAFAFLNIEVKKDLFIAVGICLPNKSDRRIRSFIILNDVDEYKAIDEIAYPREKLLTNQHFIKNGSIPLLEDLAKHLRDNYQLILKSYEYKKEKEKLYSFLYDREILPINLSIEGNLKAFAKIIQSFSKARSLNVNSSDSLKGFLFDDTEKDYKDAFQHYKTELQKLLNEYRDLEEYIDDLEQKQNVLSNIKTKEKVNQEAKEAAFIGEVKSLFQIMKKAEIEYKENKKSLEVEQVEISKLEKRKPRLEGLSKKAEQAILNRKQVLEALRKYKDEYRKFIDIQNALKSIINAEAPEIFEEISYEIDIDQFDEKEILRRIIGFKPLYKQYGSIVTIEQKFKEQQELIEDQKQRVKKEINQLEEAEKLIDLSKKGSLFARVLENKQILSLEQETALFHLLNVHWGKPSKVEKGTRYTDNLDILKVENIERDEQQGGFWLHLGKLREFLPEQIEKQLFNRPENLKQAIENKRNELKNQIEVKKQELGEIEKFQQGQSFDIPHIKPDQRFKDHTAFEKIRETASLIQNLTIKIEKLEENSRAQEISLSILEQEIQFPIDKDNLDEQINRLEVGLRTKDDRAKYLSKIETEEATKLKFLVEKSIPILENQVGEKKTALNNHRSNYIAKYTEVKKIFPDLEMEVNDQEEIDQRNLDMLIQAFETTNMDYITEYKSIVNRFLETKDQNNPEINEQVDHQCFEFPILERVLLGPKIKHVDNIAEILRENNRDREKIADTVYSTMLKMFSETKTKYNDYRSTVRSLNSFFKGKKISNKYFIQIKFNPHPDFNIDWIDQLQQSVGNLYRPGELPLGEPIEVFVEKIFQLATGYKKRIDFEYLLNPKAYFDLSISLTDENNYEIPGSTGEAYAAIVLLGIARLSKVQSVERKGIRFIILEETANLDKTNFNTFPNIAKEFGYQIITMTPKPYGSDSETGWYLHNLIPGTDGSNINYPVPASFYKTNEGTEDLETYLKALGNELDSTQIAQ